MFTRIARFAKRAHAVNLELRPLVVSTAPHRNLPNFESLRFFSNPQGRPHPDVHRRKDATEDKEGPAKKIDIDELVTKVGTTGKKSHFAFNPAKTELTPGRHACRASIEQKKRTFAHRAAQSIDLKRLADYCSQKSELQVLPSQEQHALFDTDKPPATECVVRRYKNSDIYYFRSGSMITWGIEKNECKALVQELSTFQQSPVRSMHEDVAFDEVDGRSETGIVGDVIVFPSTFSREEELDQRLSVSYALHQHLLLMGVEEKIDKFMYSLKELPDRLVESMWFSGLGRKTDTMIRDVLLLRHELNEDIGLKGDDSFWDRPREERLHDQMTKYLDVDRRMKLCNERLQYSIDSLQILTNKLNTWHGQLAEWIIIILISVEVANIIIHVFV